MSTSGRERAVFTPDRVIHEPVRLQIISYLAAGGGQVSFSELKEKLELTAGNLSVQLKRLEVAGYVSIAKSIYERKSLTLVSLTRQGLEALGRYLQELEEMIKCLRKNTTPSPEDRAGKNRVDLESN